MIDHIEAAFGCGGVGRFVVMVWRREPTPEIMERCFASVDRVAEQAGGPLGFLSVIEAGAPPPPPSMIPSLAREFDRMTYVQATAGVFEERGPLGTEVVDAFAAITALEKRRHPVKIASDAQEAIAWLAKRLELAPESGEAVRALDLVERIRAALPP